MNREIKFRGKGYYGWFYGYIQEYHEKYGKRICVCPVSIRTWKDALMYEVKEETIGQFTGLHDKNGKEIYEGDIVKTPLLDPIFGDIIKDVFCNAEITFNKCSFVVGYYKRDRNIYLSDLYDKIEVIGNIYDNKELLEDDK